MVALFVVLMIAAFLVVDVVLHLHRKPALAEQFRAMVEASEKTGLPRVAGFRIAPDAAYHPGHSWARHLGQGTAQVGLDDFAAKLIGRPSAIQAPVIGTVVRAGRPLFAVEHEGRTVKVVSPVGGVVTAVNRALLENPAALASDPYATGWVVEVKSAEMAYDFRSLLSGEMARRFLDEAAAALHAYFAPAELAPAAADGGEPLEGISDLMDEPTWQRVQSRFLLTETD